MDWITLLVDLIIPALCALITVFVVPLLRESRVYGYVKAAVEAAEQLFGGGAGVQKYRYVEKLLVDRFSLTEQEAERLIESAVYELRGVADALTGDTSTDESASADESGNGNATSFEATGRLTGDAKPTYSAYGDSSVYGGNYRASDDGSGTHPYSSVVHDDGSTVSDGHNGTSASGETGAKLDV